LEALTAASVAALTIYDMTKALDKRIEIQDVYLARKDCGKTGISEVIRAAVITISDSAHQGTREDQSGPPSLPVCRRRASKSPGAACIPTSARRSPLPAPTGGARKRAGDPHNRWHRNYPAG